MSVSCDVGTRIQIKGDPSIRKFLFLQERNDSQLDKSALVFHDIIETLICHYGVFHVQVHFSRSQILVWHFSNPYEYQVFSHEEVLKPGFLAHFEPRLYPSSAKISPADISLLLERCRILRCQDEIVYLRSGSINIFNGLIGLNFSCDGTHYVDFQTFLATSDYAGI